MANKKKPETNQSQGLKRHHELTRERIKTFDELYPDEERPKYNEFRRKENNPLDNRVISFKVSYQYNYSGKTGSFISQPQTFRVITTRDAMRRDMVLNNTSNMVLDARGSITGDRIPMALRKAIASDVNNNLKLKAEPRGIEREELTMLRKDTRFYTQLRDKKFIVENLDTNVTITNKKKRKSDMQLDITHFM